MTAQPITHCPAWCTTDHRTQVSDCHLGNKTSVITDDSTMHVTTAYLTGDPHPFVELSVTTAAGPDQATLVGLLNHQQAIELAAALTRSAAEVAR